MSFVNSAISVLTVMVTSVIGLWIVFPNKIPTCKPHITCGINAAFVIATKSWGNTVAKIRIFTEWSSPQRTIAKLFLNSFVTDKDYDEKRKLNNFIRVRCTRVTLASWLMLRGFVKLKQRLSQLGQVRQVVKELLSQGKEKRKKAGKLQRST